MNKANVVKRELGNLEKSIQKFFVLVSQLFYQFEITSKYSF